MQQSSSLSFATSFARVLLTVIALLAIGSALWIFWVQLRYPFDLEWIEGAMLDEIMRMSRGIPVYRAPSIDFTAYLYTPLFFELSALLTHIVGPGFFAPRLVSVLSSFVTCLLIFDIVRRETRNTFAAFLSFALFLATFEASGSWMAIGRVDSLMLALFLSVVYLLRFTKSWSSFAVAGLLVGLTYLTKQTALFLCVPVIALTALRYPRKIALLTACAVFTVGSVTLYFNAISDGWYSFYTFTLLNQQTDWLLPWFFWYWFGDIGYRFIITLALLSFLTFQYRNRYENIIANSKWQFWIVALASTLIGSCITRSKVGGYSNVLFPSYAVLTILFGMAFDHTLNIIKQKPEAKRQFYMLATYILCASQFFLFIYNPLEHVPTAEDTAINQRFIAAIEQIQGSVLIPYHGYIVEIAGKTASAHYTSLDDVLRGSSTSSLKATLRSEVVQALSEHKYAVIISDGISFFPEDLNRYYKKLEEPSTLEGALRTVVGMPVHTRYVYVPRDP